MDSETILTQPYMRRGGEKRFSFTMNAQNVGEDIIRLKKGVFAVHEASEKLKLKKRKEK